MKLFNKEQLIGLSVIVLIIVLSIALAKHCKREKVKTEAPKAAKKVIEKDNVNSAKELKYRAYIDSLNDRHKIELARKDNVIERLAHTKNKVVERWIDAPSVETAKPVIIIQDSLINKLKEKIIDKDTTIARGARELASFERELSQKNLTITELTFILEKQNERLEKAVRPKRFVISGGVQHGYNTRIQRETTLGIHVGIPLITF